MLQTEYLSLRLTPEEKAMITYIAQRQERSQSNAVRKLIRDMYRAIQAEEPSRGLILKRTGGDK